jgi:hypothetical protein
MRQTIQVDVLATDEATVAEVQGTTYEETYRGDLLGKGYAKKHPNDEHDAETGHALAMARALRELADVYEKRAWERINHPVQTGYARGGLLAPDYAMTVKGKFDQTWLDRVLGKGIDKS